MQFLISLNENPIHPKKIVVFLIWVFTFQRYWTQSYGRSWSYGHQEERWRGVGNSATFFLKNSFLSIYGSYRWALFVGGIRDIILQSCLDRLPQLLFSWYNFLHKNGQKQPFWLGKKKVKHLIRASEFYWYLICFSFDFGPWTVVSKGKIWPTRWSKI